MEWLVGGLLCFLGYLALDLVAQTAGEPFLPLFSPLRALYRPPHGGVVLSLTWIGALWGTVLGFRAMESGPGVTAFIVCIPTALLASAVYRHERREAERYTSLPSRHSRS